MASDTSSPNEALIAAKRARKLMDKYQISEDFIHDVMPSDFGVSTMKKGFNKMPKWISTLAVAVAKYNDVHANLAFNGTFSKVIQFKGFKVDAILARHMLEYLVHTVDRLSQSPQLVGRKAKNSFRIGASVSLITRLRKLTNERCDGFGNNASSLVVVKNQMIEKHFTDLIKYKNVRFKPASSGAYSKGIDAGNRINLSQQITGDASKKVINK